jgi:hypothetical protein
MWGFQQHRAVPTVLSVLFMGMGSLPATAMAQDDATAGTTASAGSFIMGGYARVYSQWNLSNTPETAQNDRGDPSMLRGALLLDASARLGPFSLRAIGRVDREYETNYLKRLGDLGANGHEGPGKIRELYNHGDLREAYVSFSPARNLNLKVGKQQVVWGESDFFHAMDLVHGFNSVWAPPTEESDETRKPLVLVNATLTVPSVEGSLQAIVRPGLDREQDIGNTPDIYGGRNAGIGHRGFDGRTIANADYHHPDGDIDKTTWGVRWAGTAGGLSYSLAYLKTLSPNFVVNSRFAPYQKAPTGAVGDLIYPKMDVLGATLNGYSSTIDAVLSAEVAYQRGVAYNAGTGALIGLNGIRKKDQVRAMLRMDKNLNLTSLGASNPSLWSVQIFDTWIQNFNHSDDLVLIPTYGRAVKKHEAIITNIFSLNYNNNNINPTLVLAYDMSNGGGFVVPYVDFSLGNNWRLRTEIDYYYHRRQGAPNDAFRAPTTFGLAAHNNQFMLRLTRQF